MQPKPGRGTASQRKFAKQLFWFADPAMALAADSVTFSRWQVKQV